MLVYLSAGSFVMLGRVGNICEEQKNDSGNGNPQETNCKKH